jgi:hypothetical protein
MARRGRFGRSETGASNLSATIASLVRQQKQEEEKLLLEAYYSEIPYQGGNIPTLNDVINFYKNSASLSGIPESDPMYQAYFQKINDITNYDIKREYGKLVDEFNNSDGGNYQQLIDFIGGRAMTSTDQEDLSEYAKAVEDTTSAFLRYQGEALKRREITPKEYQSITMNAIQALDPGSSAYRSAVYDAFTYEWNVQYEIWSNRVRAGTVSQSQFASWAKSFASRIIGSGIKKGTALYTGVLAAMATVGGSGGGASAASTRIGNNIGKLANAYLIAAAATGVGNAKDLLDLEENPDKVGQYMEDNPAVFLLYNDYLLANPEAINQLTVPEDKGGPGIDISSAEEFQDWVGRKLDKVQADYAVDGNKDKYEEWTRVKNASGRGSVQDDFAYQSDKMINMLKDASNPIDRTYVVNQWKSFINGENSKLFGKIPTGSPKTFALELFRDSPYLATLYQNEVNRVNDIEVEEGSITLSGKYDPNTAESGENASIDTKWDFQEKGRTHSYALTSGVGIWSPQDNDVIPPSRNGLEDGTYQTVTFGTGLDGSLIPFITAYSGEPLYKAGQEGDKEIIGHVFDLDGVTVAIDKNGNRFTTPVSKEFGEWVVTDTSIGSPVGFIDTSKASTPALLRSAIANLETGLLVATTIPDEVKNNIKDGISAAQTAANLRQAAQLQTLPNLTAQQRAQIFQLRGSDVSEWNKFVGPNAGKYTEERPGVWVLKPEFAAREKEKGPFQIFDLGNFGVSAMPYDQLPQIVDIRTQKEKDEIPLDNIKADLEGGAIDPATGSFIPGTKPTTQPGGTFFRNITQVETGERNVLKRIPSKPKPVVIPKEPQVEIFSPAQISSSMIDFRAGERQPLNIKPEPDFSPEEIDQSLIDFRAGERNI